MFIIMRQFGRVLGSTNLQLKPVVLLKPANVSYLAIVVNFFMLAGIFLNS